MSDIYFAALGGTGDYPKFRNDRSVSVVRIGAKEFECVGGSPPDDHPHVYLDMGADDAILCPYCATRFTYSSQLAPIESEPPDCAFFEGNARWS